MQWKVKKFASLAPASVVVKAEPATVYDILTDYDNYLDWFPLANHSKLLVKEGDDLAIAEFQFDRPRDAKLTMECIHTRNEMVLHRRISGNMPIVRVQWNLAAEGAGTRVTLRTEMDLRNWRMLIPGMAQNFVHPSLVKALEGRVNAFASELHAEGGRKFLEIIQTNDYLEIWFMGKKYKLTPIDE
jgi:ribosome-associated toxin RatA of RatAB toxin-antitoxin module